jgi:hypothetical protein
MTQTLSYLPQIRISSSFFTKLQDQITKQPNDNCKKPTDSLPLTII